jgi:citrate lyase subunit beta/citryl-CoA lyase
VAPLFVPGDRPDRVRKACERGAQVVVIDLEDAIPPAQKAAARELAAGALAEADHDVCLLVRVNPVSEPGVLKADLEALVDVRDHVGGVVVPKVVSPSEVQYLDELLGKATGERIPIIATIENAVGLRQVWDIAAASTSLHTLLFGVVDLSADLGIVATPEGTELLAARSTVVLASAAAGLAKPIDGPYLNIKDKDGLAVSTWHARQIGFGGKIVIHPEQLSTVMAAFAPTPEEVSWATRVLAAFDESLAAGLGVVRIDDGTFIDAPVAEQARNILRTARAAQGPA